MFGHQDDHKDDESSEKDTTVKPDKPAEEVTDTSAADQATPANTTDETPSTAPTTDVSIDDDGAWQHPGTPIDDKKEEAPKPEEDENPAPINDIIGANAGPSFKPLGQDDFSDSSDHTDNTPHDLIDVKQKALHDLAPLVSKLDQSPEDKFRTIMMMIQASDDQTLVKAAYEAAHKITDEKVRAQALLDVVNEINYFTQHPEN